MPSRHTPPRLGFRVPSPPAPREPLAEGEHDTGLRAGDLLDGRYQIEEVIGEGGVGVVYRALQLKLHRRVAVKLLQPETDAELRPRFEREAVTLAALCHPNIVSVQDYGHIRGRPFLVMELLTGRTLRELIDEAGALSVPRALSLTREVLHALAYAHELGIVHRDLKPANLVVQALPSHEHVKVLDFGFVKLLPGSYLDRGVQLSRVGFTFGTPTYMSPEHATGGDIDGRSDLYSMGILLFEMLTGTKPFDGDISELIRHHLATPVPRLADRCPALAGRADLQALVDRALTKPRAGRFASAGEFLAAIEAVQAGEARPAAGASLVSWPIGRTTGPGIEGVLAGVTTAWQRGVQALLDLSRQRIRPALARGRLGLRHHTGAALVALSKHSKASWRAVRPKLEQAQVAIWHAVAAARGGKTRPGMALPANALGVTRPARPATADVKLSRTTAVDDRSNK